MIEGEKGCGGCHKIGDKTPDGNRRAAPEQSGTEFGAAQCDACHTRHTFSVEEARQPQACETCHMGFDHPQWEMYSASKHGVRNDLKQKRRAARRRRRARPARPATCRMAITKCARPGDSSPSACPCPKTSSGPPIAPRFCRRWACSIPQGKPTALVDAVKAADVARLTQEDWQRERDKMIKTCNQCHSVQLRQAATAAGRRHDQERRPPDGRSHPHRRRSLQGRRAAQARRTTPIHSRTCSPSTTRPRWSSRSSS